MNCSQVAHKWNEDDKILIFKLLEFSNNPVYVKIGKNRDHALLRFIPILFIKCALKSYKTKQWQNMYPGNKLPRNYKRQRFQYTLCDNEEQFRRSRKLLKQVNNYIQG